MGVKKHYKKRLTKITSNSFYKQRKSRQSTKNPKPIFLILFITFLGLSWRISTRPQNNIEEINLTLVIFWPLTRPPTTGVTDFFCRALDRQGANTRREQGPQKKNDRP
jgi:hypothetical protein